MCSADCLIKHVLVLYSKILHDAGKICGQVIQEYMQPGDSNQLMQRIVINCPGASSSAQAGTSNPNLLRAVKERELAAMLKLVDVSLAKMPSVLRERECATALQIVLQLTPMFGRAQLRRDIRCHENRHIKASS